MFASKIATAIFCCLLVFVVSTAAQAGDDTRACDDPHILRSISERFVHQSYQVNRNWMRIKAFDRVHEHRAEGKSEFSPVARRYCGATVTLSNGRNREVWYLIESNAGLAGLGNDVEFCVSGFDRWNVYNASCRVLR